MTTWNEIIDIKLNKIKAAKLERSKKKNGGCFKGIIQIVGIPWLIFFGLIGLFAIPYMTSSKDISFKNHDIGQALLHRAEMGDISLFQLGERKLNQSEQKKSGYKKTTTSIFEKTNTISEKYFIDNNTDKIGKILDTIPMFNGHLWLKVKLEPEIYKKPINFNVESEDFTKKLKMENSNIFTENLKKDFYIRVCDLR